MHEPALARSTNTVCMLSEQVRPDRNYPRPVPHPIMFTDDDFGLRELRAIALDFPGSFEKISWGRPVFCAPKMFAVYGLEFCVSSVFECV